MLTMLTQRPRQVKPRVGVDELHRLCAFPDPRTLDRGIDLPSRPCPRRDEIRRDEERALQLLTCPKKIDSASVLDLLQQSSLKPQVNHRKGSNHGGDYVSSWLFGAWCHRGNVGVSRQAKERPHLTRVLASLTQKVCPAGLWTTLVVNHNTVFSPHTDSRNYAGTWNTVVCLNDRHSCDGCELWTHDSEGTTTRQVKPGLELPGRLNPLVFDPKVYHGTEPWQGERYVISTFTIGGLKRLTPEMHASMKVLNIHFPMHPKFG